jgi:hypothetical protein
MDQCQTNSGCVGGIWARPIRNSQRASALCVAQVTGCNQSLHSVYNNRFINEIWDLVLGLPHDLGKHLHVPSAGCGDVLSEFNKVDGVFPCDFLGVECTESQESLP